MTLDEAIKHCEEVADLFEHEVSRYDTSDSFESYMACKDGQCAEEYRQIVEWLNELKECHEIMEFIDLNVRVIETNDGVMIRFGGGNVCEWARRKGERS